MGFLINCVTLAGDRGSGVEGRLHLAAGPAVLRRVSFRCDVFPFLFLAVHFQQVLFNKNVFRTYTAFASGFFSQVVRKRRVIYTEESEFFVTRVSDMRLHAAPHAKMQYPKCT